MVVLFVSGGAAHLLHHLEDPSCDRGPAPASHVCASCAGLHAGAMTEQPPAPVVVEPAGATLAVGAASHPIARLRARETAPRPPPFA